MTARIERPDPDDARPVLVVLEMSQDELADLVRQRHARTAHVRFELLEAIREAAS